MVLVATYQQLYNDHSDTLQCPCSELSIPYGNFLNITFILHQVCSSDIISKVWLDYLASYDPIFLPSWTWTSFSRDFRIGGSSYFQLLSTFCSLAKNNFEDAQNTFINTQFISDHVLDPSLFNQQSQIVIESYVSNTKNDFQRTMDWIMIAFTVNYVLSGTNTNFKISITGNTTVSLQDPTYFPGVTLNDGIISFPGYRYCSCATKPTDCFVLDLIYTNGTNLIEFEQNFIELPTGCTPLTGFLSSTFTWWYNETYFENIEASYAAIIDSQLSPSIQPLNTSVSTRFGNDEMEYLVREMFVETWTGNDSTHFHRFYNACAPISCSYTIVRRRDFIVVLFLFISICVGMNKILGIVFPVIGKSIFLFIDWRKNRDNQHGKLAINSKVKMNFLYIIILASFSIIARVKQFFRFISKSILNMNIYETTSDNEITLQQQRLQTRIYVILFVISLGVLLFYTAIIERNVTKTVSQPSIEDYEQLLSIYSDVYCPCMYLSIPYNDFVTELSVKAYYQGCSSGAIQNIFTIGNYN